VGGQKFIASPGPVPDRELIESRCRSLDPGRHPMLGQLSRDVIYDDGAGMAPGGLILAQSLAEELSLEPGARVLDLGCGRGQSSLYLATRYQAQVTSLDLWISAEERKLRAIEAGVGEGVTTLQGDVRRGLPIAAGSLDAIFCMQAFHCFGTQPWVLTYLTSLLKPGGKIGIAQGCFRDEPDGLPSLFADTGGWNVEYHKYHSTDWWRRHLSSNDQLDAVTAREVLDGDILWEDDILYRCQRADWQPDYLAQCAWLVRHVLHGQLSAPSLTHCLVTATRTSRADGVARQSPRRSPPMPGSSRSP
jgi:SAM-dependent methyltransferase